MIAAMTPDAVTPPAHPLFEQPWPEGEFRFFQLGHVVDDVFAAAASWVRAFGIGPFHVLPVVEQRANYGDEIRAVCEATSKPVNVLGHPGLSVSEITEAGGRRISVGSQLTWVAVGAMAQAAEAMRDRGDLSSLNASVRIKEWLGS